MIPDWRFLTYRFQALHFCVGRNDLDSLRLDLEEASA